MKIAVNTRLLRKNQMDGIGWFTYNTMKYIVEHNPDIEFHFFFDSGVADEFLFGPKVVPHNLFPPAKHALLNIVWFEWSVRRMLYKIKPDLFLSPDGLLCLGWNGKQYGVMHDIAYHHNPKDLKFSNRTYYNFFFPKYSKKACRLGTVSEYSKNDIVQTYHVPAEKIDIVYSGINSFHKPTPIEDQVKIKAEFSAGEDFFLFVGTLHPRKNLVTLLKAFELFKERTNSKLKMVIAGRSMYKVEDIYQQHEKMVYKADVIFAGRVADDKINRLLGAAFALTFVPTFEGFGLPIIEAMQSDVPVICSNVTSMPEVAGDAALLVDPLNVEEIAEAMIKVYSNDQLRNELIQKGRERKNVFSWNRTAELLWESVTKCL